MVNKRLELRVETNPYCLKCSRENRSENTNKGICSKIVSERDKLPVRCVGEWANDKIHILTQYFGIFATGMKDKWDINYIEICSGPGRCVRKEDGFEFDGTALAIINHPSFKYIKKALFIDKNEVVVDSLNTRIVNINKSDSVKAVECDYNNIDRIKSILSNIPKKSLNLVFLDPTDCSIPFSLIIAIKNSLQNVDFIINVAFGTDVIRNIRNAILNPRYYKVKEKY